MNLMETDVLEIAMVDTQPDVENKNKFNQAADRAIEFVNSQEGIPETGKLACNLRVFNKLLEKPTSTEEELKVEIDGIAAVLDKERELMEGDPFWPTAGGEIEIEFNVYNFENPENADLNIALMEMGLDVEKDIDIDGEEESEFKIYPVYNLELQSDVILSLERTMKIACDTDIIDSEGKKMFHGI